MAMSRVGNRYGGVDFTRERPTDDVDVVDESFLHDADYILPNHNKTSQVRCYICDTQASIKQYSCPDSETYPRMVTLMNEDCVRRVPVCSLRCNKSVLQKQSGFMRKQGSKIKQVDQTWKLCDVYFTEKSTEVTLSKCSACKSRYYCSKGCQERDWNAGHKKKCKQIQKKILANK